MIKVIACELSSRKEGELAEKSFWSISVLFSETEF